MISLPQPLKAPKSLLQTDDRLSQIREHWLEVLEIGKEHMKLVPQQ